MKFIERLRHEVRQRSPLELKPEEIGFFDNDGIQTGEEWIARLSDAVCNSRVCIAICSPAYVCSEFCGKEIRLFLERLKEWQRLPANSNAVGRSIIPVIWVRTALPPVLQQFQHNEKAFPAEYVDLGLRTLCQLRKFHDKNTQIVITLAERIVAAAAANLPPLGPIPHFDHISSVFHEEPAGARYGVAVVAITKGNLYVKPFGNPQTLRDLIVDACAPSIPWRTLAHDGTLNNNIERAKLNREALLVVADFETLANPLYKKIVSAVDGAGGEQSSLIVYGADTPDPRVQSVEATLKGHFPNALGKVWYNHNSIRSAAEMAEVLAGTITKMRSRLINEDAPREARDSRISAAAAQNGVPIAHRPALTGPAGI